MTDSNPISDKIFQRAGSGLKEEIALDIRGKIELYWLIFKIEFLLISAHFHSLR